MKHSHLVPRKYGSLRYFHFRGCVPQDLISFFGGRKQFQVSLKNVRNGETLLVSTSLISLTEQLFNDIFYNLSYGLITDRDVVIFQ